MSKGVSGLFNTEKKLSNQNPTVYTASVTLKDHIVKGNLEVTGNGISGAHNKDNFLKIAEKNNIRIESSIPNSQMEGVEQIFYSIPKKDKSGKPTGEYKATQRKKTVYDPKIISNEKYIKFGIEAANNAAKAMENGKLGREWSGNDSQGVSWHGYCDKNGNITSFYPND